LSFIFTNYWSYNASPQKVRHKLEQKIASTEASIRLLAQNEKRLESLIQPDSVVWKNETASLPYGVFLYQMNNTIQPELLYWNSNTIYIKPSEITKPKGNYFVRHQNGDFELVLQNISIHHQPYQLACMIPIRWSYFIENKYLQSGFDGFDELHKQYEISEAPDAQPILNGSGQELFRIRPIEGRSFIAYDSITILLRCLSILLLLFFLNALAEELVRTKGFAWGFGWLTLIVFYSG